MNNEQQPAPQDLREMADRILSDNIIVDSWGVVTYTAEWVMSAMLQLASEVSAEKGKEIEKLKSQIHHIENIRWELERKFEDVNDTAFQDGLRMNIELNDKRIAELQKAVKTQIEIIENLTGGKRIVNLGEAIAYYKSLII